MDHETKSTQETSPGMVSRIPNDPMAVTWAEKYSDTLEKYWNRLPNFVGTFIASVAVFILGSTIRGEWLHILVHFLKAFQYGEQQQESGSISNTSITTSSDFLGFNLADYRLQGFGYYWVAATTISYIFYLGIGGFLHWYYYIRQRGRAIEWKCQPNKFLSPELERHEILLGSFSLLLGSTCSALVSCYLMNGGKSTIYYDVSEYGWLWYFASWPVVFVWQDYLTYWTHRMYHLPFLYKKFHKLHHKYKQPTAFSVTAIHPFEFLHMQLVLISPMVIFPVHWTVFVVLLMYLYYHGIIDHSGINFKAYWWQPWQPDCIFHDNHHQYFHVNFGFNCALWDKIHGTYRQKNKVYREDIFYGKGKDLTHCSKDELKDELRERENENHLAYRGTVRDEQVKEIKHKLT
ncbi:delta(7)-sterol 5(6)-desaturase erg32-like [Homarus americanus]|uniref:delta(7)-sterol 5(6)-desaturase erg32-like n=1 Tax=Homarus americanus TaxID=6706 RepID=UPI001C48E29F|nr:delta(7)-sterol 5(6)-desaturase erg32-like [Homarus americanus]